MTHPSRVAVFPLLAATALAVGACASGEDVSENRYTEVTASETSSADDDSSSPAPTTETETVTQQAADAAQPAEALAASSPFSLEDRRVTGQRAELVIQDVRAGTHEGYDRVVFEFAGTGTPGYLTGYTAEPLQQASGLPVEVPGNASLEVIIQGVPMGMMPPNEQLLKPGPQGASAGNVVEVIHGATFEADAQYFIGLDSKRPYNVFVLQDPPRLVVDVQR